MKGVNDKALVMNKFKLLRPQFFITDKLDKTVINACRVTESSFAEHVYSVLEWAL
jgi:hypothetical protein